MTIWNNSRPNVVFFHAGRHSRSSSVRGRSHRSASPPQPLPFGRGGLLISLTFRISIFGQYSRPSIGISWFGLAGRPSDLAAWDRHCRLLWTHNPQRICPPNETVLWNKSSPISFLCMPLAHGGLPRAALATFLDFDRSSLPLKSMLPSRRIFRCFGRRSLQSW